jgi:iron complex transport system substrate-binding protein
MKNITLLERLGWLLASLLLALLLSGCGETSPTTAPATITTQVASTTLPATTAPPTTAPATQFPVTVTDGSGFSLTLPKKAERVVCLSQPCLDIMLELGLEPVATLGVFFDSGLEYLTRPDLFGTKAANFARIAGSAAIEPNLEDITKIKPDLIMGFPGLEKNREALKGVAPIYIGKQGTYKAAIEALKDMGKLTGRVAEAETAAKRFQERLTAYKTKSPNNRAIIWFNTFNVRGPTKNSIIGSLMSEVTPYPWEVSGANAIGWASFSFEKLLEVDPYAIFVAVRGKTATGDYSEPEKKRRDELANNSFFKELQAVKNQRVYEISDWLVLGEGTRALGLLLDEVMTRLYPEVFPKALP